MIQPGFAGRLPDVARAAARKLWFFVDFPRGATD
jgi:hypothetical protein